MAFEVTITPDCLRQVKRLSKKYPSLKDDVRALVTDLVDRPDQGIALGKNLFKVRLAIRSKGHGRSSGARVITCVLVLAKHVYVAAIYDKSERATLTDKELLKLAQRFK